MTADGPLAAERAATVDEIAGFRSLGHTVVRALCSPEELESFVAPIVTAADRLAWNRDIPLDRQRTYDRAFHQAIGLWVHDDTVRRFVTAERMARVAAELLGTDGVRLYHDQALIKRAGGGPTPWHQDAYYWPVDGDQTITMWMPLFDAGPDAGTMRFADGSHHLGDRRGPAISDDSDEHFRQVIEAEGLHVSPPDHLAAGDASFHAGWTLHSAGPNTTDADRPAMTVIYVADGAVIRKPQRDEQRLDLALYLPGARPGQLVATDQNPLLWSADN